MRDPYLYLNTEILINLLGIKDSKGLSAAESDYVTLRLSEIAEDERLIGVFDFSALAGCITVSFKIYMNGQESLVS